jgi:hypothetical protein
VKRTILLLAATLLLPHGAAPAGPLGDSPCGERYFYLYTLTVEAKPRKKVYARGESVKIDFLVTRPGPEDPGGNEIPLPDQTPHEPAEGAEVHASFWAGNVYAFNKSVTDENGEATVKVATNNIMAPGPVDLEVAAHIYYNRGGCPDGEEVGYNYYPKAFTLT